jgi:hypothetical protein
MAQQTRTAIQTQIDADIYTNTNNEITGDEVNTSLTNLNDSAVNWLSDVESVVNNDPTKVPNSAAVYAALAGVGSAPVITVTKAAFDALVLANDLRAGYWYLVTGAVSADPIWASEWDALVLADTVSSVHAESYLRSVSLQTSWIRIYTDTAFSALLLFETDRRQMVLDATQANTFAPSAAFGFIPSIDIIVSMPDVWGQSRRFVCRLSDDGSTVNNVAVSEKPLNTLSTNVNNFVLDFANNIAIPTGDISFRLSLSSANILAGGQHAIPELPAPPMGYYWKVLDADLRYTFNTTPYSNCEIQIISDGAPTDPMLTISDVVMAAMTTDSHFNFAAKGASADQVLYQQSRQVFVSFPSTPTVGDGAFIISGTAVLLPY